MDNKLVWRKDLPKRLLRPRAPSVSTMGVISRQLDKMFFGEDEDEKIFRNESGFKMKRRFAANRQNYRLRNQFI